MLSREECKFRKGIRILEVADAVSLAELLYICEHNHDVGKDFHYQVVDVGAPVSSVWRVGGRNSPSPEFESLTLDA
jgi:hypothetical protein